MSQPPTTPILRVLTPEEATAAGYKAIATPVCIRTETAIFDSMQLGISNCDAIWISHGKSKYSLARRAIELWTDGGATP